jgi:hypothetical protein
MLKKSKDNIKIHKNTYVKEESTDDEDEEDEEVKKKTK